MKRLFAAVATLFLLNSCWFEHPFDAEANVPVNPALLGRWESVPNSENEDAERMLVLKHSENEYAVEYPVGEKAMFFRAVPVELAGGEYIQIQLIGTAEGPVKPEDRKFHLLKIGVDGDAMEMSTINPEVLGKEPGGTAEMRAMFAARKDDPQLFEEPQKFRRLK